MYYRTRTLFTIMILFMRSVSSFGLEVKEMSSSQCHEECKFLKTKEVGGRVERNQSDDRGSLCVVVS